MTTNKKQIALVCLVVIIIACIVGLLAYRGQGRNAWEEAKAELAAKGIELDTAKLIPSEVPAAQNFFAHPVVRELLPVKGVPPPSATNPALAVVRVPIPKVEWHFLLGDPFDIEVLKRLPKAIAEETSTNSISIEELLAWVDEGAQALAGLREANLRPFARVEGKVHFAFHSPITNFTSARSVAKFASSSASLHLLADNPAAALRDLDAMQAVMRALNSTPRTWMSCTIHETVVHLYLNVVSNGLAERWWGVAELRAIADKLAAMNNIETKHSAIKEGQLIGMNEFFENLARPLNSDARHRALAPLAGVPKLSMNNVLIRTAPDGWIRRNQAVHARLIVGFLDSMDGEKRRYYAAASAAAAQRTSAAFAKWSPHTMLASIASPNLMRIGTTMIKTQFRIDQTAIACALEAHNIKNGIYPTALADLIPEFITKVPHDPFSGNNYIYRKVGDGFVLYSVGPNEKDDGGTHGESISHLLAEDFVWKTVGVGKALRN